MKCMKKPAIEKATVEIEKSQLDWLKKNKYNLNSLVRSYIKELIDSVDKTKQGIVIPAMIKAPTDNQLRKRLKKTKRLSHLAEE